MKFILDNVKNTFGSDAIENEVEAAWTGIRPLVLPAQCEKNDQDFDYSTVDEKELRDS